MTNDTPSGEVPAKLAEEILRTIYGDDLKGCPVSLDRVAAIIATGIKQDASANELVPLYEKVVEAVHLLSIPPQPDKVADPKELQLLLSERLDSIHAVTTKTMETIGRFKAQ